MLCVSLIFLINRYTLVLLSAGVIGLSNGEVADTLDMFIQSVLNRFEQGLPLCHISGSELMLSAAAANIIDPLSMTQVDLFLKSFSEIASSRRILIIRLLLSSLASRKTLLTPWIPTCIMNIVNGLMFSCHQSDLLNCIVEFIQKDAFMFSHCVQFHWLQTILSNHVSKHESTSVQFLLKTSMRVAAGIRKYIGIAKRDSVMRDCHVACHFIAETFILRLLPRLQDRSHPVESTALDQEFLQHFHDILVITAFPQQVSMQSLDIPHDLKTHVSFPRPPALMLMSPLVTKEDLVCSSFCQFVREATQTLPGVSSVVFETFLQQSAGILSNRKASPYSLPSDPSGFLGLLNLGCTCYFNSITQQLFMIPGFAASVISARVKVDAVDAAVTSEQVIGDVPKSGDANVLARGILDKFQELMVYLRHGAGPVVLPHFFCDSFRFPDGSCILPDVQQDALEFFHILCDHLDNALKGGHDEKLLSRFFGGRSATQLICKGCPHRYERFEHFFTLQLAVFSNRANSVLGALHEFVAGELLEGDNQYFCSLCDKKVDTVKRTVLADLPDTIILGLKRFDFNYDTMQRIKLNVEVPFDHDLDMFPFCRENMGETPENSEPALQRERGYYEYSLAGIVVHSGMADSGHYFSIIRDQNGLWHKFNDDIVSTIQQLDLSQFFGGQSLGKSVHTNAYILVYNRKVPMFQHQYGAITAIESAVSIVQDSQVLTMDKMFVNSLRIGQLWSVFGICIQEYLSTSENEEKGIMYVNFLLKLSVRSPFDVAENMALYLQPLKGFLSSAGKCSSILEHFFSKYHSEHLDVVHNDLFQPIWDSESRQFPALPVFFTQLLIEIITNVKDGKYKLCDPVVCQTIFLRILDCCGNVSWGLYSLLKDGNPLDVDPTVALIAYAVNFFFLSAFHLGLADIILECCSLDQPIDGTVTSAVVKMCVTFLYFANVSEFGPKLRSKRRAHLRKLVQECRRCAFFCFLRLFDKCLSIGIGFQAMLPLQLYASIIFDSNAEYLINHLRIPEGISGFLENQVEEMFYNTAYNILMRVCLVHM
jgi:ubiquitin C-terminal hydrolase